VSHHTEMHGAGPLEPWSVTQDSMAFESQPPRARSASSWATKGGLVGSGLTTRAQQHSAHELKPAQHRELQRRHPVARKRAGESAATARAWVRIASRRHADSIAETSNEYHDNRAVRPMAHIAPYDYMRLRTREHGSRAGATIWHKVVVSTALTQIPCRTHATASRAGLHGRSLQATEMQWLAFAPADSARWTQGL
jgi:hypothetical protein